MLKFSTLVFTDEQRAHALSIVDRIVWKKEGWQDMFVDCHTARVHWLHVQVPSSAGGKYLVFLNGYDGKMQTCNCQCEAGQGNRPCYHVKAALLWVESLPATQAAKRGDTLFGAIAQCIAAGVLDVG